MPDPAGPDRAGPPTAPLLSVSGLRKHFPIRRGPFSRVAGQVRAVDDVSFDLHAGECLGLVGESGSGKTTVGRTILRALDPTAGKVIFRVDGREIDLAAVGGEELRRLRRHMQMVFQDPYSSLNPRMTVLDIVGEPLLVNGVRSRREREGRVRELLSLVGLGAQHLTRYPHAFSGGQRQRIGIARALALHPRLVVADEPVSALDVSVQAQVLNLLQDLQERLGLTYVFISHDLNIVRHICSRVAVMYAGRLVELAGTEELFRSPRHPYTAALLSAAPGRDPSGRRRRIVLTGEPADPADLPSGCAFHPRCRHCRDECRREIPALREVAGDRFVRCGRAEELQAIETGTAV